MRRREAGLLLGLALALLAWHAGRLARWARQDRQLPGWDASVHLSTAQDYREAWAQGRWLGLLLTKPRPGRPAYPPFYHYTLIPCLSAASPEHAALWLNLAYLALLLLAAGAIAWELGGLWPAAFALIAVGSSAPIAAFFREAFVDLAVAAWVSLAYACLLRSRLYRRPGPVLALGLCAGLALLSRWSAVLFLLPAWCAGLARQRRAQLWRATAVAAALCAPWYLANSVLLLPRVWTAAGAGYPGLPATWTWANWRWYPAFWAQDFSWPVLALLAAGALLALSGWRLPGRRWRFFWSEPGLPAGLLRQGRAWVALWLLLSYAALSLVRTKDPRYLLPSAAAVPALGAAGLPAPALAAAAAAGLWQGRLPPAAEPGDWHAQDILREVEARRDRSRPLAELCLLANHRNLNSDSYNWLLRHWGLGGVAIGGELSQVPEWADFALLKSGDPGIYLSDQALALLPQALAGRGLFARAFAPVRSWPLPDASQAVLFQRRDDLPGLRGARRWPALPVKSARLAGVELRPRGGSAYEVDIATISLAKLDAPIRRVRLRLEGARLLEDQGRVYVLGLATATVASAQWRWDELSSALSRRCRLPVRVDCDAGAVRVRLGRSWLEVLARPSVEGDRVGVRLEGLRLLGLPVPGLRGRSWDWSLQPRAPYQPYAIRLAGLHLEPEGLRLGD